MESSTDNTSLSIISSNYEILELARLKASQSVVNLNQFYPEIKNDIQNYSDIYSSPSDKSDTTVIYPNPEIVAPDVVNNPESSVFPTELNEIQSTASSPFSLIPQLWTGKNLHILPSMAQIVDTRASDRYALGMTALKSSKWLEAIGHFTHCILLKPKEPSYYANRAEIFIQLVDFQSAILNYKRACILDPGNDDFLQRLAFLLVFQSQILFDQSLYSSALDSLGRAIEIAPTNLSYQVRAIAMLAAMHRHSECLVLVNKQIAVDSSNADFLVLRAKLHSHFRNFSLSYYDLIDAVASDSEHCEARKLLDKMARQADDLENQSTQLALVNRLQEAASRISLAIELNPIVGGYHVKRGALHRRLGDFTAAIDDFIMAMDKVDHDEESETHRCAERQLVLTFNDFAVECFERGCFDDAINLLNKAIQREKSEPRFYVNRGDCFFHLQQWEFALADYRQASALLPEFVRPTLTRIALIHYSIAQKQFNKGDYDECEKELTEAIKINPRVAVFWNLRCRARYIQKNLQGARKDIVCGILLTGLDKSMDSIYSRLFPDKNPSQIIECHLAKSAKNELDRLVREREEIFNVAKCLDKLSEIVPIRETVPSCIEEDRLQSECIRQYYQIENQLKKCSADKRFMKKNKSNIVALPDLGVPKHCESSVFRVGVSKDGIKFYVDNEGIIVKAAKQQGWRKFKEGIPMK